MLNKILKNKKGGTMILLTILILTSIITVTLASAELIRSGLIMGRTQVYSTVAFFAAEAGAERILYDVRYGVFNIENPVYHGLCVDFNDADPSADTCLVCTDANTTELLPDSGASFKIKYELDGLVNSIKSSGSYNNLQRAIELRY